MSLIRPRVEVHKSRSLGLFKGQWYVLAFGRCYRTLTWRDAIRHAIYVARRHAAWARKVNKVNK